MADKSTPAIRYTSRDYGSLRQEMIDGIESRLPEWTSRSPQDFGIVLIELFATQGDILSYYTDRVANESFLPTATQRDSVLKLAAGINYRPRGTSAAKASIDFTTTGVALLIPAGTLVRSSTVNGNLPVVFSTDADLVIPEAQLGGSATVTQGQPVILEQIGESTGNIDQSFVLLQIPVVESSIQIMLLESPDSGYTTWSFVNTIIDARPNDSVYTTSIDGNGVVSIIFGDGVNGRVPPLGAVVYANYRVGGGEIGNVAINTIIELVLPIEGVLSLTNPAPASGGTAAESTDAIRTNAPRSLTALNRAVTLEDYASLALAVPEVAKANAEALVYSNVTVYVAPFGGIQPAQKLLNDVVNALRVKRLVGVDIVAASPTYVGIDTMVTVVVDSAYTRSQVQTAVTDAMKSYLAFDNTEFGMQVSVGDVYATIAAVKGVLSVSLTQLSRRGEGGVSDVFMAANEIPQVGTVLIVNAIGGLLTGEPDTGSAAGAAATPSSAPVVLLLRDDPTTNHFQLSWTPGTNSTKWFVEVQILNAFGEQVGSTVVGPTAVSGGFEFDLPDNEDAATFKIRTQAYNGALGPVMSPYTTIAAII